MSHPSQNTALSLSARLFCYLGPPAAILLTSIASPRTALLSPLSFVPTALSYKKWRESNKINPSRRGKLESMVWTYATVGTVGLATAGLAQLVICIGVTKILFRSREMRKNFWSEFQRTTIVGLTAEELTRRSELAFSWQNWVFNGVFTFIGAGFLEETLKYLPIAYARRQSTVEDKEPRNRSYIDYALAGALSFGVVENIAFLYSSCEKGRETWPKLMLTVFERVVLSSFGHLLVGSLTALRATRRDYYGDQLSWWGVVGPSVILHGAFDFVALSFSALEGNVGWIHPTGVKTTVAMFGLLTGLVSTAAWQVRQNWKTLNDRDRQRK